MEMSWSDEDDEEGCGDGDGDDNVVSSSVLPSSCLSVGDDPKVVSAL